MTNNESTIEVLNDLIQINNDRIEGYNNAIENLKDGENDLRTLFTSFKENSIQNIHDLNAAVNKHGGKPVTDTSLLGKVHRAWMDIKSTFTAHDRDAVIYECVTGEKAAQEVYEKALNDTEDLSAEAETLIRKQQSALSADKQIVDNLN